MPGYLELIKLLALIVFPILVGIWATTPIAVPLFFGEKWIPAIRLIQILTLLGMMKTIGNPIGSILLARGRADIGFKWNIFVAITNTLVFWFIVRYGVYALAWSEVVLCTMYFFITLRILHLLIGLDQTKYLTTLIRPTAISIAMGIAVIIAHTCLTGFAISKLLLLFGLIALGVVAYGLLILACEYDYFVEIWNLITGSRGKNYRQREEKGEDKLGGVGKLIS